MQGNRGWMGGVEYIKNLIFALNSLPQETRKTFQLCLLSIQDLESGIFRQLQLNVDQTYSKESVIDDVALLDRIQGKILRTFFKYDRDFVKNNLFLDKFFSKEKFEFVYPLSLEADFLGKPTYRSAAWIPDFQHKYLPQFFSKSEIHSRDQSFSLTARNAKTIILSSKSAELDCQKFFPESINKTQVLSFRTSIDSSWYQANPQDIQEKYCLPDKFFLVSNQFWQHKNHLVIFQALKILQSQSIYPQIVFTGSIYDYRRPDFVDTILQTIHQLGLFHQVYLLGLIPRSDQIQLIRRSIGMIQPSLFEGWSTVVEDGRCLGKSLILSDISVHLEQNPPDCLFFERNSPESLAIQIADRWNNLLPGPNLEQEAIARNINLLEVQAYGYRFLEIAQGRVL
jgi:glycosyltransferase involved in cell wall biosynthesis